MQGDASTPSLNYWAHLQEWHLIGFVKSVSFSPNLSLFSGLFTHIPCNCDRSLWPYWCIWRLKLLQRSQPMQKSYLWNSMQKDTNIAVWHVFNWTKCHHYNYRLKQQYKHLPVMRNVRVKNVKRRGITVVASWPLVCMSLKHLQILMSAEVHTRLFYHSVDSPRLGFLSYKLHTK